MSAIYRYDITIPASAIDQNGHLNNVEYVSWMQAAAIAHANDTGCTRLTTEIGATWIVRKHQVEYLQPAFVDEVVILFTWITTIRKVRSQRKYQFFRPADQQVLAIASTDWVFVDAQTGSPLAIPTAVANAFEVMKENIDPVALMQTL
ncbi:MAG: acyl-CoA thioesterase [Phormidesmis sp.]